MQVDKDVYLDPDKIPEWSWAVICKATYEMVKRVKSTPEGKALIEKETAERRRRRRMQNVRACGNN